MADYRRKPITDEVEAFQLKRAIVVYLGPDELEASPGDWLIQHADGRIELLDDRIFQDAYEPIPAATFSTTAINPYRNITY